MQQREQREQQREQRDRDQRDREHRDRDRERDREHRERDREHRERDREHREREREAREASAEQQGGPYRCLFCRASFCSELELQFHLPTHTRQFHCPVPLCGETFQVEFLLDKHMQTQHSGSVHALLNGVARDPREEDRDAARAAGEVERDREQRKQAGKQANGVSAAKTNGDVTLADPQLNNNQAGASCDICDRGDFASEAELAAHRKLAHHKASPVGNGAAAKNGAVSLLCAYCNESCKSRAELESHMKTHSHQGTAGLGGTGKHKCNICDELCPSAAVLAEHKLTHCKVVQGSACTVCRASVTTEDQFRAHLRQHSQPQGSNPSAANAPLCLPAQCVICRQTLVSDVEVRLHARFHLQGGQGAEQPSSSPDASSATCCICLQSAEASSMVPTSSTPIPGQPMVSGSLWEAPGR